MSDREKELELIVCQILGEIETRDGSDLAKPETINLEWIRRMCLVALGRRIDARLRLGGEK